MCIDAIYTNRPARLVHNAAIDGRLFIDVHRRIKRPRRTFYSHIPSELYFLHCPTLPPVARPSSPHLITAVPTAIAAITAITSITSITSIISIVAIVITRIIGILRRAWVWRIFGVVRIILVGIVDALVSTRAAGSGRAVRVAAVGLAGGWVVGRACQQFLGLIVAGWGRGGREEW